MTARGTRLLKPGRHVASEMNSLNSPEIHTRVNALIPRECPQINENSDRVSRIGGPSRPAASPRTSNVPSFRKRRERVRDGQTELSRTRSRGAAAHTPPGSIEIRRLSRVTGSGENATRRSEIAARCLDAILIRTVIHSVGQRDYWRH